MMNGRRESDSLIVSRKPSNKIRDNKRVAEKVERRGLAKGNPSKRNRAWTLCRRTLLSELERVRQVKGQAFSVIVLPVRHYPRQEPGALVAHAGICAGGAG